MDSGRTALSSPGRIRKVGFVSTRLAGTDGVTLETTKWADVFEKMGLTCCYIAGEVERSERKTCIIKEASFNHPKILRIRKDAFGARHRTLETTREIHEATWRIKQKLYECQGELGLDLLVAENALTIPMNIPLGLALVEFLIETGIPCIAHHHDFFWERQRFLVNAVGDYLRMAFPPALSTIQHVVINSQNREELSFRTGVAGIVIPNVMNFEEPLPPVDSRTRSFRKAIGIGENDWLILQPTRVVARKGIEHAIELVKRLDDPRAKLVISHAAGDEGYAYLRRIRDFADMMGVEIIWAADIIGPDRALPGAEAGPFSIADAYLNADLVTYPSTYEGFGNAFLEAIYFKRPILTNRYSIYRTDIEPRGFNVVTMDGFVTDDVVADARRVLTDTEHRREMVERNFELGSRFFSYHALENHLRALLTAFQGVNGA